MSGERASKINQECLQEKLMSQVKSGDTVKMHYTGKLENGEVFDSSRERDPLEFTIGSGKVMPGIEKGIIGMEIGDTRTIEIPPEDALGPRREDLVVEMKKSDFPEDMSFKIGQMMQMQRKDGDSLVVTIRDINGDNVTLDANHPLAGRTLVFDVELLEIA
jgi:FKBP-type peptidyl-prolyl cis-trans isomerase 2